MESNFRGLYYFITAAEEMNFTRAAKRLYITQQSLSKHIKRLEEQYEVQLFERHPNLRLTLAGEHLLRYARHVIREENALFNNLRAENNFGKVRLAIGAPTMRCSGYLPEIFRVYAQCCPNVVPYYSAYNTAAATAALLAGDIDLYFSTAATAAKQIRQLPLMKDDMYFVVSRVLLEQRLGAGWKDFLRRYAQGIRVVETLDLPVVLPLPSAARRRVLDSRYDAAPTTPEVVAELSESSLGFELCVSGLGAAFVPKSLLYRCSLHLAEPIYALPVADMDNPMTISVVCSAAAPLPQHVAEFIDCARTVIPAANAVLEQRLAQRLADPEQV